MLIFSGAIKHILKDSIQSRSNIFLHFAIKNHYRVKKTGADITTSLPNKKDKMKNQESVSSVADISTTPPPPVPQKIKKQSSEVIATTSAPEKKVKKQTSLGDFFAGAKKKVAETVEVPQVVNADIGGDGKWTGRKQIKLACWNVNGLRAVLKREDLQKYLNSQELDVLCLNETKIDEQAFLKEKISEMIPKGYFQYWNFCIPPIKGYSGVAVLSKEKAISVKQGIDVFDHSQEGRVLTVEYADFFLVVVYVPNAGMGLKRLDYRVNQFDKDFQTYLNKLKLTKHVVLCGDLNVAHEEIDIANPDSNHKTPGFTDQERASFGSFLKTGWVDTFRDMYPMKVKYSWWSTRTAARSKNIGWRIDYFVVNQEFKAAIMESMINNDVYGSDHCPVEIVLEVSKGKEEEEEKIKGKDDQEKEKDNKNNNSEEAPQDNLTINSSLLEKKLQE